MSDASEISKTTGKVSGAVADGNRGCLDPEVLAALGSVDLRARLMVDGFMQGLHRSPRRGVSVEFAQHRAYAPGDDVRFLDWKVFGRTDKLQVRQFHQETQLDLVVLVDRSPSMAYRGASAPWRKYDAAATLAAALMKLALDQRDRGAVWLFADRITHRTGHGQSTRHLQDTARLLDREGPEKREVDPKATAVHETQKIQDQSTDAFPTDLSEALHQTPGHLNRRSVVAVISDFFDDPKAIHAGLARLRGGRHDVLLIELIDPAEAAFDFRDPTDFVGLESAHRLAIDPAALRRGYLEALHEHQRAIETTARKLGFDHLRLRTDQPAGPALAHFMARRAAILSRRG